LAEVRLDTVSKIYDDGTTAVDHLDLTVADGEFLVLVGPSGCGKTTALRMVAGLEEITDGAILIDGRVVNDVAPRDRDLAMVFQSYALYPHLDVFDNIAFGMRMRHVPKGEIDTLVRSTAEVLGLSEHLTRRPGALSGGQRQRVAMGRAMVRNPSAFLMDEPLSNLDAKLRIQMRAEIARMTRQLGTTTLYVTHDQTEAMTLGHRVAVMKKGVLQQVAAPDELYEQPANLFVAGFIGSPAMNLLPGRLTRAADARMTVHIGDQSLPIPAAVIAARPRLAGYADRGIVVGIRPEDLADADLVGAVDAPTLRANVDLTEALGSDLLVHVTFNVPPVVTDDTRELARDAGVADLAAVTTTLVGTEVVARFSPRSRVRLGDTAHLVVDVNRLQFFDPVDGTSIW
jgi:multiple sugar transport system ATP-binding protein